MGNNYIGHIIKETRLKKQISASKLCAGLCSPSMLTRIESGERYPNKLLFDALMERMGESGKNYNLIGTAKDTELYHLVQKITTYYSQRNYNKIEKYIEQYRKIMNPKNALELQILYVFECLLSKDNLLSLYDKILSAIKLTIKDFNCSKIQYYMLSNYERSLINALGGYYSLSNDLDTATNIYNSLLFFIEQYANPNCDILHISSVIKYNLIVTNLRKKDYSEMIYLCKKSIPSTLNNHQEIFLGRMYYQYCYAELALNNDQISEHILLAYYTYLDINEITYAEHLRTDIKNDLGLVFEIAFY